MAMISTCSIFCRCSGLNDGDGGFYLDKACVVSRDPLDKDNFGKQNVGIYRMEAGKRKLGLQPVPMHDIALHLPKRKSVGICRSPLPW